MFEKGHTINKGRIQKRGEKDAREIEFLDYYFSDDSETKGNALQSALRAGYSVSTANDQTRRIINRFGAASASVSLNAAGVNKPYLAARIKKVLEKGKDKEIISAARLAFTLLGESTNEVDRGANVFNAPVMIIQGMTNQRMKALRGAIPQLSPEEAQRIDEEASAARLEQLRHGELPLLPSKSQADPNKHGWEMRGKNGMERPDVESGAAERDQEAAPDAG